MKSNLFLNRKKHIPFWKTLISTITVLIIFQNTFSQSVTIPANNINNYSSSYPFGSSYGYTRTVAIYTAAELGLQDYTTINSLAFYYNSYISTNGNTPCIIRISNTTQTNLVSSTFANEITGTQTVFTGDINIPTFSNSQDWLTKDFSTPFIYTGNNIKICIEANFGGTGNIINSGNRQFRWSFGGSGETWTSDNVPPNYLGAVSPGRPNIQFGYLQIPANDACSGGLLATSYPYIHQQTLGQNSTNNGAFLQCNNPMNDGVWYKFLGTGGNMKVNITDVQLGFDPQVDIYTGNCLNLTCVGTTDLGNAGDSETLTIPTTLYEEYFVNIGHYSGVIDGLEGNFKISIFDLSPSTLSFKDDSRSNAVYENSLLTLTVERLGGSNGICSVNYYPNGGNANYNIDYGQATGTLTWADGDNTPKIIQIPILQDASVDDLETFTITISDAINAGLFFVSSSVIIIDTNAPPVNDNCLGALLASSLPYSNVQTRGQASTNNTGFLQCADPMNDGLWYKFIGNGSPVTVDVSNTDVDFDPQLDIYSGACTGVGLSCIGSADIRVLNGETLTFNSVLGTNYFINVGQYRADKDFPEGNFKIDITSPTLANNQFEFSNLKVYPNPVTNILNIDNSETVSKVSIANLLGQELLTKTFDNLKTQIDIANLQSGTYLVKIFSKNKEQTVKVVKN